MDLPDEEGQSYRFRFLLQLSRRRSTFSDRLDTARLEASPRGIGMGFPTRGHSCLPGNPAGGRHCPSSQRIGVSGLFIKLELVKHIFFVLIPKIRLKFKNSIFFLSFHQNTRCSAKSLSQKFMIISFSFLLRYLEEDKLSINHQNSRPSG